MKSIHYTSWWGKLIAWLIFAALFLGALAILYLIFGQMKADARAALYLEAAKALLQLIVVIMLGALVTLVIKQSENNKKADKALHDFRVEFLNRLRSFDDAVKKSRYVLRSSGLTNQYVQHLVITPPQIDVYDAQLSALQDAESGVGRLIQDITSFRDAFSENVVLENKLRNMQLFLRELLEEYEKSRPNFPQVLLSSLPMLAGFTGLPAGAGYNDWLSGYTAATVIIRKDLLPLKQAIQD
ncbi:MAG: hypothetical protein WA419_00105 [Silvibacterium sp.]